MKDHQEKTMNQIDRRRRRNVWPLFVLEERTEKKK